MKLTELGCQGLTCIHFFLSALLSLMYDVACPCNCDKFHAAAVSKDAVSKDVRRQWARMLLKVLKEVRAQNFKTCYAEKL